MTFNDLLAKNNYTVYKLSKDSKVATSTIFDIVFGKSKILDCSGRVLLKLSKSLNVTIEDLLALEQELYNPVFENELPDFLMEGIRKLRKMRRTNNSFIDCYYDEVNSSINVCETENLISKDHANYLRRKYLS